MEHKRLQILAITVATSLAAAAGLSSICSYIVGNSQQINENTESTPLTQIAQKVTDISENAPNIPPGQANASNPERNRVYVPLNWDVGNALLALHQGSSGYWGTCGECAIASTLNSVLGTSYTETDITEHAIEAGLCELPSGGMTLDDMVYTYAHYLPEDMDVYGYGGSYAPSIDGLAAKIESGKILNVSVYGEMMREGGHTGEGQVYSTHWLLLHSVERNEDGSVKGFGIVDSASPARYISAQDLSYIYYGHDGTEILDPSCVQVYGWRYADWGEK